MNKKLYNHMDWAEIEAVVYSEEDHPKKVLGPKAVGGQTLIQAFLPQVKSVSVLPARAEKPIPMELMDESGYYAVLIKRKFPFPYVLEAVDEDGKKTILEDPYAYPNVLLARNIKKWTNGIYYKAWEGLGAHPMELNEKKGVNFAVWAPEAMRVSVVGDFNGWDGRIHEMERHDNSGIFELFIPGLTEGILYKYEIKAANGTLSLKSDPFAFAAEKRPDTASKVADISSFEWSDEKWIEEREDRQGESAPMAIYELHLSSFLDKKAPSSAEEGDPANADSGAGDEFPNYREIAPALAKYVKDMGYTHVELMPIMEYPEDSTFGYQTLGFYAPTSRYGSPEDFAYFVNYMHKEGIGVILDWSPACFPKDSHGLKEFDGRCLYESADPRKSFHPEYGTLSFDLSKPEVCNYLLSNALFWILNYHADGLRVKGVASMLYLDYGRGEGGWTPNLYGGAENLEGIEFFKNLNAVIRRMGQGAIMIAQDDSGWPGVTSGTDSGGLGFHYKWNESWRNDFLEYMHYDPLYRTHHYGELCLSMVYAYAERFMLPLSHDALLYRQDDIISRLPGTLEERYSSFKAALAYFFTHPGKKLIFMGQDAAERGAWQSPRAIDWEQLKEQEHEEVRLVVKDLIKLYKEKPALHALDFSEKGFEWINCISANENILVYIRKTEKKSDTLLVVVNFENIPRKNYKIGAPFPGKFKEIFNSDAEKYGGFDFRNPRVLKTEESECDGRPDSLRIKVPPLAVSIFELTK
ncbi:MAG: 1,4-alpha-glucan branching protein GlgB [Lachnospiraceae bacterium]|nr:1,4-alpha-glucan branching protein GlgB [Lachnospiraceae bacterium]